MFNTRSLQITTTLAFVASLTILSGCGGETEIIWPNPPEKDWAKLIADRGMAKVWSVDFDVEKVKGETRIETSGTFGPTPEETQASKEIVFGDVFVTLESTGTKKFNLLVNGKKYGVVKGGNQVLIDEDRKVFVNKERRQ